ncbi:APHP domain protein [Methanocaldococcus infernus ME]|uniref:APHP domain protein n=1 Tax=Methanocaldococcus infernus (strain DSM 11812 / JCM 15783 / ME) TaxID=573063 RepID=D5VU01_METIM|nr:CARDB domain-containing protein [Methanocaldococcus infernus]ADG14054.1 APHP domain protein [Methanocaldococcus infernus ME]
MKWKVIMFILMLLSIVSIYGEDNIIVELDPSNVNTKVGDTFNLTLNVKNIPNNTKCGGLETYICFNSSILNITKDNIILSNIANSANLKDVSVLNGKVWISLVWFNNQPSGNFTIATLRFKALNSTKTEVYLKGTKISNNEGIAYENVKLKNSSVTIIPIKPDLVGEITSPKLLKAYANNTVSVLVRNIGERNITNNFSVKLLVDTNEVGSSIINGLNVGESKEINFTFIPTEERNYVLCILVDCNNNIDESNESNNKYVTELYAIEEPISVNLIPSTNIIKTGKTFEVNIVLNNITANRPVKAIEGILVYDPNVLECENFTFLINASKENGILFENITYEKGKVLFKIMDGNINHSLTIATVKFKALNDGNSDIKLTNLVVSDANGYKFNKVFINKANIKIFTITLEQIISSNKSLEIHGLVNGNVTGNINNEYNIHATISEGEVSGIIKDKKVMLKIVGNAKLNINEKETLYNTKFEGIINGTVVDNNKIVGKFIGSISIKGYTVNISGDFNGYISDNTIRGSYTGNVEGPITGPCSGNVVFTLELLEVSEILPYSKEEIKTIKKKNINVSIIPLKEIPVNITIPLVNVSLDKVLEKINESAIEKVINVVKVVDVDVENISEYIKPVAVASEGFNITKTDTNVNETIVNNKKIVKGKITMNVVNTSKKGFITIIIPIGNVVSLNVTVDNKELKEFNDPEVNTSLGWYVYQEGILEITLVKDPILEVEFVKEINITKEETYERRNTWKTSPAIRYHDVAEDVKSYILKTFIQVSNVYAGNDIDLNFAKGLKKNPILATDEKITKDTILIGGPVANPLTKKLMDKFPIKVTNEYPGKNKGVIEMIKLNVKISDHLYKEVKVLLLAGSDRWGTKAAVEYFKTLDNIPEEPIFVEWKDGKAVRIEKP